jgi:hypothetical protein
LEEISSFPEILQKIPVDESSRTALKKEIASYSEMFVSVGLYVYQPTRHNIPKEWDIHHQQFPTS